MAALQFADVPGYNALIIRRNLTDLTMPGALISMSHDWLGERPDCSYNGNDRKWTFRGGGTLTFGYMAHPSHVGRYRGTEYHFIGWDELGEIPWEDAYTFLFSRRRRPGGLSREDIISLYGQAPDGTTLLDVPLRTRAASNPGGPGMDWVKARFVEPLTRLAPFIRSSYRDNPGIIDEEYEESLAQLTEVERRRMGDGDWEVQEIPGAVWRLKDIYRDDFPYWRKGVRVEPEPWEWVDGDGGACMSRFDTVIVGVDPSVGEGAGDECGIVAVGRESKSGRVVVLEDSSVAAHPDVWGKEVVLLADRLGASRIVLEKNNGGEENRIVIRAAADLLELPMPTVKLISAQGSKAWRANSVVQGYRRLSRPHDTGEPVEAAATPEEPDDKPPATAAAEAGKVPDPLIVHSYAVRGGRLEAQMVGWVPEKARPKTSPDRVDALVHALRELLYPEGAPSPKRPRGASEQLSQW